MTDLDDLLGPSESKELPALREFWKPVGTTFLADVFRREVRTVKKKLASCAIKGWTTHKGTKVPLYDFVEAAGYLVDPKVDLLTWIKSQRAQDLPHHINDQFWKAMLGKQKWEREARNLWHTTDVLDVFGTVAMTIKETMQLWVENLPGKSTMSTEQYKALTQMVNALKADIHLQLVELPAKGQTYSSVTSLDAEIADADAKALGADGSDDPLA